MIRHLSATGLTSSTTSYVQPNVGYRWRILSILAWLDTGSGTGTRRLYIAIAPYQTLSGASLLLVNTGDQSATSSEYFTQLFGALDAGDTNGMNFIRYSDLYADASAHIAVQPTLITGDSYGYDIQVLEEPDI